MIKSSECECGFIHKKEYNHSRPKKYPSRRQYNRQYYLENRDKFLVWFKEHYLQFKIFQTLKSRN